MELTKEEKNSIENLIILVRYVEDNSIFTEEDKEITRKSIATAERLIGRKAAGSAEMDDIAQDVVEKIRSGFSS